MPEPIDLKRQDAPPEVPDEGERAKAQFTQTLSAELQRSLASLGDKPSAALASFIGGLTVDRLVEKSGITPEQMAEFFENLPAMKNVRVMIDKRKKADVRIGANRAMSLSPEHQQLLFQEFVRAQLLARAADIYFQGSSSKEEEFRQPTSFDLDDWLATYAGLQYPSNNTSQTIHGQPSIDIHFPKQHAGDLRSEAFENDADLFSDMMIAFGVREGALGKGMSFNRAWGKLDGGYENHGIKFSRTKEGVPYRAGKREEDVKLVLEKANRFGEEGPKVKTYQDLESDVQRLQQEKTELTEQVGDLEKSKTELRGQIEKQTTLRQRAELDARETQEALAKERKDRETAETTIADLQERMKEMLAIAEEKVGLLSKDTRTERMRKIVESAASKEKK